MSLFTYEIKKCLTDSMAKKIFFLIWIVFLISFGIYVAENSRQEELVTLEQYQEFYDAVILQADKMKSISIFSEKGYSQKNVEKTLEDFQNIELPQLQENSFSEVKLLFQYPLTDYCGILLIFLIAFILVNRDTYGGMGKLQRTLLNGRGKLAIAKVFSLAIFSFLFQSIFYGSGFIFLKIFFGEGSLHGGVQSIRSYISCPWMISIKEFIVYVVLLKSAMLFLIGLIFFVLCSLIKNLGIILITFLAFYGVEGILYAILSPAQQGEVFKYWNIYYFFQADKIIGEYRNLPFFNLCISAVNAAILFLLVGGFIFLSAYMILILGKNRFYFQKYREEDKRNGSLEIQTKYSIVKIELLKFRKIQKVYWFLIMLTGILFLSIAIEPHYMTRDEMYYWDFVKILEADNLFETDKKLQELEKEYKRYEENARSLQKEYKENRISGEEYYGKIYKVEKKLEGRQILTQVMADVENLQTITKEAGEPKLVFKKLYEYLLGNERRENENALLMILSIAIIISGYLSLEHDTHMEKINRTMINGDITQQIVKRRLCFGISCVCVLMIYLCDFWVTFRFYGSIDLFLPMSSLNMEKIYLNQISIIGFLFLLLCIRMLCGCFLVWWTVKLQEKVGKGFYVLCIVLIIWCLPIAGNSLGIPAMKYFSMCGLLGSELNSTVLIGNIVYIFGMIFCLKLLGKNRNSKLNCPERTDKSNNCKS